MKDCILQGEFIFGILYWQGTQLNLRGGFRGCLGTQRHRLWKHVRLGVPSRSHSQSPLNIGCPVQLWGYPASYREGSYELGLHLLSRDWLPHSSDRLPKWGIQHCPEGPSTQHLRTLVPNAIKGMVLETRVLKYWILGSVWVVAGH